MQRQDIFCVVFLPPAVSEVCWRRRHFWQKSQYPKYPCPAGRPYVQPPGRLFHEERLFAAKVRFPVLKLLPFFLRNILLFPVSGILLPGPPAYRHSAPGRDAPPCPPVCPQSEDPDPHTECVASEPPASFGLLFLPGIESGCFLRFPASSDFLQTSPGDRRPDGSPACRLPEP